MDEKNAPVVDVRVGMDTTSGFRIIVEPCPYCGKKHVHYSRKTSGNLGTRVADCGKGEYTLVVEQL